MSQGVSVCCPDCSGDRRVFAHVNRGRHGCRFEWVKCPECKGEGVVPWRDPNWATIGGEMREARKARGESLWEMASRLGIRAADLSAVERGAKNPVELKSPPSVEESIAAVVFAARKRLAEMEEK